MEIEKKFLIAKMPDLSKFTCHEIEQAYLNRNTVFRIRKWDDKYIFTYKTKHDRADNLIVNTEIEEEIPKSAYLHLRDKADNYYISKTRYIIPLEDGLKGELDVFHGRLEGLTFIEVEFPSEEAALSFKAPDWFGADVSGDSHYRNGFLSTVDKYTGFSQG